MNPAPPNWLVSPIQTPGAVPDETHMDTVELLVSNLDMMRDFYRDAVTLEVIDEQGTAATLGSGGLPIMRLRQAKELPPRDVHGAGLYHTAILFPDESRLATSLVSMAQRAGSLYEGSADHFVSEAFYFHDPEGNGIELYHDRPRSVWTRTQDGSVKMGSSPLDPNRFMHTWYNPDQANAEDEPSAAIGHVHLQVGDIDSAYEFYIKILGFDVTARFGNSALFLSAGGYHHHIGMNTWNSAGAGPRAASLGLGDVRIRFPHRRDVEELADRLRFHRVAFTDDGRSVRLNDPWGTQLVISPQDEA